MWFDRQTESASVSTLSPPCCCTITLRQHGGLCELVYCVKGVGVSVLVGAVVVVSEAVSIFIADWFHYHCQHSSQQQQHTPHKQKTVTHTRTHTYICEESDTHTRDSDTC